MTTEQQSTFSTTVIGKMKISMTIALLLDNVTVFGIEKVENETEMWRVTVPQQFKGFLQRSISVATDINTSANGEG